MKHKCTVCLAIICLMYFTSLQAETQIAVIGDMPYNKAEAKMLDAPSGSIYQAIQSLKPAILIHLGDIKSGGRACSDKRLLKAKTQITKLWPNKTVYTPGDNDWTDCDRFGHNELERLAFIREHFIGPQNGLWPDVKNLSQDPNTPENLSWTIDDIRFISANIPGTNFGRNEISSANKTVILDYANKRETDLLKWLEYSFKAAASSRAIVLSFHADIFSDKQQTLSPCESAYEQQCDGYSLIKKQLRQLITTFSKPVLLIHGDTGDVCLEKVSNTHNAWRINAAGDGVADALAVSINTATLTPFNAYYLLNTTAVTSKCATTARL